MKNKLRKKIRSKIVDWNNKFPIDYWWRKKYGVPFGSERHKNITFIEMFFDYEESTMMKELEANDENIDDVNETKLTQSEIDDDFDNLDLDKFTTNERS